MHADNSRIAHDERIIMIQVCICLPYIQQAPLIFCPETNLPLVSMPAANLGRKEYHHFALYSFILLAGGVRFAWFGWWSARVVVRTHVFAHHAMRMTRGQRGTFPSGRDQCH